MCNSYNPSKKIWLKIEKDKVILNILKGDTNVNSFEFSSAKLPLFNNETKKWDELKTKFEETNKQIEEQHHKSEPKRSEWDEPKDKTKIKKYDYEFYIDDGDRNSCTAKIHIRYGNLCDEIICKEGKIEKI